MHEYHQPKSPNHAWFSAAMVATKGRGAQSAAQAATDSLVSVAAEILCRQMGFAPGETTTAMLGTDIALKHQVSEARFRDLLAEAERQRSVNTALDARPRARRAGISEARTAVATLLLRAGSWLMPEETPDACNSPVTFELRPGQ